MVALLPAGSPAVPVVAATILLVRDGASGLEVLMVVRHHQIDFASGATVFPGGKVGTEDRDPRLLSQAGLGGFSEEESVVRVAAIRETFEESGLLLARDAPGSGPLIGSIRLDSLHSRWQKSITAGGRGFLDMVCEEGLCPAGDALHAFAHWVTPEHAPKRFDTHFFLAAAPVDQLARHDGFEAVESFWINPLEAMRHCEERKRMMMFPTLCNLARLAQSGNVADAIEAASRRPPLRIQPVMSHRTDGKKVPTLPSAAGYPLLSEALMDLVAR